MSRHWILAGALTLAMATPQAIAGCSRELAASFVSAERLVSYLRPETAGVASVFAYDGSEYTAGEALWMKAKLRTVMEECGRNDEAHALPPLQEVLSLVRAHHQSGNSGASVSVPKK